MLHELGVNKLQDYILLPPANEVYEGNVFHRCLSVHGRRGVCVQRGSLSRRVSAQGERGLFQGERGLFQWGGVVSVHGEGGSLSRGRGSLSRGRRVSQAETPPYVNVRAVCILLECILVFIHTRV